jgi:hypothetical protein
MDTQNPAIGPAQPTHPERAEKHLARGLEDVSYLFLSQSNDAAGAKTPALIPPLEMPHPAHTAAITILGRPQATITRDQLVLVLSRDAAALEHGMRAVDANIPCDPYGIMDILAIDEASQLVIIETEPVAHEGMLLRALCHDDWIGRNLAIVRRMYHGHKIDLTSRPRMFLVASQFSPVLICAARSLGVKRVNCFRYHAVEVSTGTGLFFEAI